LSSSQEAGCSCQVCWPAADFNSCRKRTYTLQTVSELRAPSAKNIQNLAFKHGRLASLKTLSLYTPVQPLIKDDLRANLQIVQETTAFIHHGSFKVQQVLLLYSCLLLSLLCFCFVLFWPILVLAADRQIDDLQKFGSKTASYFEVIFNSSASISGRTVYKMYAVWCVGILY
jgi:hypothetical protein